MENDLKALIIIKLRCPLAIKFFLFYLRTILRILNFSINMLFRQLLGPLLITEYQSILL
jgi:hypothetical protein